MTKADIVNKIARNTGLEKTEVQTVIEGFMECVIESLSQNTDENFGTGLLKSVDLSEVGMTVAVRAAAYYGVLCVYRFYKVGG